MNTNLGQRIPLEGTINTRDLGGYTTLDGRKIRFGRIYRTDALFAITEKDKETLSQKMNLKKVVDLRSIEEIEKPGKADQPIPGCQIIVNPVQKSLNECLPDPFPHPEYIIPRDDIKGTVEYLFRIDPNGDVTEAFENVYQSFIMDPYGREQYANFLNIVYSNREGAIAFHCADGKDRAGVAAAIVLMALGVSDEDIIYDYLLTNANTWKKAQEREQYLIDCGMKDPIVISSIKAIAGVRENWIRAFLNAVEGLGGRKRFFNEYLSFSDEKLEELRNNYLE